MRRSFLLGLFVLLSAGLITSTAGAAIQDIAFDVDFYGLDTTYEQGVMDTGGIIVLQPCQYVNVDLWVRGIPAVPEPSGGIVGFGAAFGVLPNPPEINFEITDYEIVPPFSDFFVQSKIIPEGVYAEGLLSPGSFQNGDLYLASFVMHCTKPSIDELWVWDYSSAGNNWILGDGTVLDDLILPRPMVTLQQVVPIPGALWLLGSGLIGLVGIRRRLGRS
jgi:hypothetical protein